MSCKKIINPLSPAGKIINALSKNNGETLTWLARRLGISMSYLSMMCRGQKEIELSLVNRIIETFDFTDQESFELLNAVYRSNLIVRKYLSTDATEQQRLCAHLVANHVTELSEETLKQIISLVDPKHL